MIPDFISNFVNKILRKKPYLEDYTDKPKFESDDDHSLPFMHSSYSLCSLSITYIYKDDLKISPAWISFVTSIPRISFTIKPILCLLSDNYPIFGSRRKSYMIIGCLINLLSCILIASSNNLEFYSFTFLLITWNLGSSLCFVAGDAFIVEGGRQEDDSKAMSHVSIYFVFKRVSVSLMSYGSSILLLYIKPKNMFWISSCIPLITLVGVLLISEPSKFNIPPKTSVYNQYKSIKTILCTKRVYYPILFLFISYMTPSSYSPMFYFMTEELHFSPEIFGRAHLFECFATVLSIYLFNKYCQDINLQTVLFWSTLLSTPFYLLPIVVVQRWNLKVGIPDTLFVLTDAVVCEFIIDFQCIPIMILTSRLCPKGLESTVHSLLVTILNHGYWTGALISGGITLALGITSTNFDNLKWLLLITSISNLLPLRMIHLLPTKLPCPEYVDNVLNNMESGEPLGDFEDSENVESKELEVL